MYLDWTVAQIDSVAETFEQLEVDLFKLRREIEHNWISAALPIGEDRYATEAQAPDR